MPYAGQNGIREQRQKHFDGKLPKRTVDKVRLVSLRKSSTRAALRLPPAASTSKFAHAEDCQVEPREDGRLRDTKCNADPGE
jgi:hypothetical protein